MCVVQVYCSLKDEKCTAIAKKNGIPVRDIVTWNVPAYPDLKTTSKLNCGTHLTLAAPAQVPWSSTNNTATTSSSNTPTTSSSSQAQAQAVSISHSLPGPHMQAQAQPQAQEAVLLPQAGNVLAAAGHPSQPAAHAEKQRNDFDLLHAELKSILREDGIMLESILHEIKQNGIKQAMIDVKTNKQGIHRVIELVGRENWERAIGRAQQQASLTQAVAVASTLPATSAKHYLQVQQQQQQQQRTDFQVEPQVLDQIIISQGVPQAVQKSGSTKRKLPRAQSGLDSDDDPTTDYTKKKKPANTTSSQCNLERAISLGFSHGAALACCTHLMRGSASHSCAYLLGHSLAGLTCCAGCS